jgi:hypothetical protein
VADLDATAGFEFRIGIARRRIAGEGVADIGNRR